MSRILRLCPRCGEMTDGDCCPSLRSKRQEVYQSPRWRNVVRPFVLARDNYTCVDCKRKLKPRQLVADHVDGFTDKHDPRAYDVRRIRTRCHVCSGRKDGGSRPSE